MERHEPVGEPFDAFRAVVFGDGREPAVVGEPPHLDDVVDDASVRVVEGHDAEVHVVGEAAVERDLPFAVRRRAARPSTGR